MLFYLNRNVRQYEALSIWIRSPVFPLLIILPESKKQQGRYKRSDYIRRQKLRMNREIMVSTTIRFLVDYTR
jgi:hypothetical protein